MTSHTSTTDRASSNTGLSLAKLGASITTATMLPMVMAGNALAATGGTASSNGLGKQLQNMSQEGSDTIGVGSAFALYALAIVLLVTGIVMFFKSQKEDTRRPGMVAAGLVCFILAGVSATGPKWINSSANTASNGDAEIGSTAKSYEFK
ncbi:hypothetical protein [Gluconobacter oxydans]|uniref:Uncharacterized protein n=1 Tax=Gluconobacter oxydans TaxID=442 RepID=A0A149S414_GLUOY|nr:hypothetical protein [Gluconobacter oxydans]KXV21466.1 hypothetical protein AD934_02305 [Gluconobacter oxydans]